MYPGRDALSRRGQRDIYDGRERGCSAATSPDESLDGFLYATFVRPLKVPELAFEAGGDVRE